MCSLINKQLLLTAYAYLFIMEQQKAQQGSEALQLRGGAASGCTREDEGVTAVEPKQTQQQTQQQMVQASRLEQLEGDAPARSSDEDPSDPDVTPEQLLTRPKTTEEQKLTQKIMEILASIGKDWRTELRNLRDPTLNGNPKLGKEFVRPTVHAIFRKFWGVERKDARDHLLKEAREQFDPKSRQLFDVLRESACIHPGPTFQMGTVPGKGGGRITCQENECSDEGWSEVLASIPKDIARVEKSPCPSCNDEVGTAEWKIADTVKLSCDQCGKSLPVSWGCWRCDLDRCEECLGREDLQEQWKQVREKVAEAKSDLLLKA